MNASEWIWRTGKAERRAAELEGLLERVTEQLVARLGTNSSEWATVREVRQTLNR